jgi:4-amino-4-deoxy-L-arabinose transferase-like glycosyltransferase
LECFGVPQVVGLLHVLLGVVTACIVWRLGLAWGLPPLASLLAAALVTIDPILINQQAQVMTETLAAFLGASALLVLSRAANVDSILRAVLAGLLLGLCMLCRPAFAVWLIAVVVVWPFAIVGPRILLRSGALIMAAVVAVAPWAVRNQLVFSRPIVTTTHGGHTLLLANNSDFYDWLRDGEWGSVWDSAGFHQAWVDRWEGKRSYRDEPVVDASDYQEAWQNIAAEPGMFAYACLVRVGRLWGVLPHQLSADESPSRRGLRYAVAVFYTFELVLAAIGAWMFGRRLWVTPAVWGVLLLLAFTAVHTVYWTDLRMRAPLMSVVAILAAAAVAGLASRRSVAIPSAQIA